MVRGLRCVAGYPELAELRGQVEFHHAVVEAKEVERDRLPF